ncbi:MAG: hypothetical protein ACRDO2_09215 [Nocardioidaceae bacterium]
MPRRLRPGAPGGGDGEPQFAQGRATPRFPPLPAVINANVLWTATSMVISVTAVVPTWYALR